MTKDGGNVLFGKEVISKATPWIGNNSIKPKQQNVALIKQDQNVLVHSFRFKLC